jgi:four helix bundle protein
VRLEKERCCVEREKPSYSRVAADHQSGSSRLSHKTHRDLVTWRNSMELLVEVYRVARQLPDVERYGLSAQLRRAAVSVPANIAEGFGRSTRGDYLRHLSIASGSMRELETHLEAITLLEYLPERATKSAADAARRTGFLLYRLQRSLMRRGS